jgi:cobalamin biosynthesis protein CobW
LDDPAIQRASADLRKKLRPGTCLVATRKGRIDIDVLFGMSAEAEADVHSRPSHHELVGEGKHDHDDFESFVVHVASIADRAAFMDKLRELIARHDILRLKGFLSLTGVPSRLLVQAVGPRVECYFDRSWQEDEPRIGNLVVIGLKGLNREDIAQGLRP